MSFNFPASPTTGQTYTAGGITYVWNGTAWDVVDSSISGLVPTVDIPPPTPQNGQLWWESDAGAMFIWFDDGNSAQWVQVNGMPGKDGADGADGTNAVKTALARNHIVNPSIQISQETPFGTVNNAQGAYNADQWYNAYTGPTPGTNIQFFAQGGASAMDGVGTLAIAGTVTAYPTVAAGNYAMFSQNLEGLAIADLNWGTARAIPAVLALEVACSKIGTFGVGLRSSNADRSIVFPFTIPVADSLAYRRFTFAIPAITSGTWPKTNVSAASLSITALCGTTYQAPANGAWQSGNYLGVAGHTNLLGTSAQQMSIRGIGLYADPDATGIAPPFEVPNYGEELARCKRYYEQIGMTLVPTSSYANTSWFKASKRVSPILTLSAGNANGGTFGVMGLTPLEGVRQLVNPSVAVDITITANARM